MGVMIVVNKAVLRVIWAYFQGVTVSEMPYLAVPGHNKGKDGACLPPEQVIELRRSHSGFTTEWLTMNRDTVPEFFWEKYKPKPGEDPPVCVGFAWYGKCNLSDGATCTKRGQVCLHVCARCKFEYGVHPIVKGSCPHFSADDESEVCRGCSSDPFARVP